MDKKQLRRGLDPNLGNAPHTLMVRVQRVSGLPPAPRQRPDELRPYITYQVPGHGPHFSRSGQGPHPIFDDERTYEVRVDDAFCAWVESAGGLHFLIFDDASPSGQGQDAAARNKDAHALGLVGEVKVSLKPLLHDALAVVQAPFALTRDLSSLSSPAVGTLEVTMYWQDFQAARDARDGKPSVSGAGPYPVPPPLAPPPVGILPVVASAPGAMSEQEMQTILGRLVRRLAAQGIKSVENAFEHLDVQGTGALRQQDFIDGMSRMYMGMSDDEASRLFRKLDNDGDGNLLLQELRSALSRCTQADAPQRVHEDWVGGLFARIREAMNRRTDLSAATLFDKLARESGTDGVAIDQPRFCRLLRNFREDLSDAHLIHLWLTVDKDRNGFLTFDEFADLFGCTRGIMESAAASGSGPISEEYFNIIAGRLLRHLLTLGVQTVEQVVQRYDIDNDGRVTRAELEACLAHDSPNLSQSERTQFAIRMDADKDGVITAAEMSAAFKLGETQHKAVEARADAIFDRIRSAIARHGKSTHQVFMGLTKNQGFMSWQMFGQLCTSFASDLKSEELQQMWQLLDKNNDGSIEYKEFERYLAPRAPPPPPAATAGMSGRPQPAPLATVPSPPSTPARPAAPAAPQTAQDPRSQMLMKSIRSLIAKHGKTPVQFFQGMDTNRDGRLSADEFAAGLIALGVGEERSSLRTFFLQIEGAVNGRLPIERLAQALSDRPQPPAPPAPGAAVQPPPTRPGAVPPPAAPGAPAAPPPVAPSPPQPGAARLPAPAAPPLAPAPPGAVKQLAALGAMTPPALGGVKPPTALGATTPPGGIRPPAAPGAATLPAPGGIRPPTALGAVRPAAPGGIRPPTALGAVKPAAPGGIRPPTALGAVRPAAPG
eukprot:TRINITY_DN6975_c0_g1_i2.p1 TRINITY_DN6975_c0_g1~~TRINITY_DN6975_c0_g1_i2.p1  ORF type:complete len:903 (-),score=209.23 TRINITY_DN6975_c0_g1_i2:119-2776(-)